MRQQRSACSPDSPRVAPRLPHRGGFGAAAVGDVDDDADARGGLLPFLRAIARDPERQSEPYRASRQTWRLYEGDVVLVPRVREAPLMHLSERPATDGQAQMPATVWLRSVLTLSSVIVTGCQKFHPGCVIYPIAKIEE